MKRVIEKINKWAAQKWANVNINKENLALLKQVVHISKEDIEYYNLVFFEEHANLKKPFPKK
jgi:hypothetical protein